jgi:hypothetical protein
MPNVSEIVLQAAIEASQAESERMDERAQMLTQKVSTFGI